MLDFNVELIDSALNSKGLCSLCSADVCAPVGRRVPGWVCRVPASPGRPRCPHLGGGSGQIFQLLKSLNAQFAYQIHFTVAKQHFTMHLKQHFTMHLKIGDF